MSREIVIKVGKPETENEIQDFKQFRTELKDLLSKGKIKVVEKYRDFTFTIIDSTVEEQQKIALFLKQKKTLEFIP